MPATADTDLILGALLDELRAVTTALNELHHPVYPANPLRIAELEARAELLRADIAARRRELRG
jgi:capsule polysaccharide export protein KpsE/RkpR